MRHSDEQVLRYDGISRSKRIHNEGLHLAITIIVAFVVIFLSIVLNTVS